MDFLQCAATEESKETLNDLFRRVRILFQKTTHVLYVLPIDIFVCSSVDEVIISIHSGVRF